jgi:hypothetical protein
VSVIFEDPAPNTAPVTNRADVACFVGLARTLGLRLPGNVRAWLRPLGVLLYPFALDSGASIPLMPPDVSAWFLQQSWLGALTPPAGATAAGTLHAAAGASDTQLTLAVPLSSDPPLFAALENELVTVSALDASRTVLTLVRGIAGSLAAPHAAATPLVDCTGSAFALLAAQLQANLSSALVSFLDEAGWLSGPFARDLDWLVDVPLPFESFAAFTTLFDDGSSAAGMGTDYVACALRSFFAQGGRRAYVVCMGDPVAPATSTPAKTSLLQTLLRGGSYTAGDPSTWHGVGHLAALVDVSYVALPDLPMLCAPPPAVLPPQPQPPPASVVFAECSSGDQTVLDRFPSADAAPRLGTTGYATWTWAVANVLQYLVSGVSRNELHLREMTLVVALPLPQDGTATLPVSFPEFLEPGGAIATGNLSSAFLQLAYPWLVTTGSSVLLEGYEPPDGTLVGLLARNALTRGAFASAVKVVPANVYDLWPELSPYDTRVSATPLVWDNVSPKPLVERVSLFGRTPAGLRLLSDVTAYPSESYRSGAVKRLVDVIARAARLAGEAHVFGRNGPALWARVQATLVRLMTALWSANALNGATAADAFGVRCDASTMTQNDLDNGRLIAVVSFTAAATIEVLSISLALGTDAASTQQVAAVLAEAS